MDTDTDRARITEAKAAFDDADPGVCDATPEPSKASPVNRRRMICMPSADAIADAMLRRSNTEISA